MSRIPVIERKDIKPGLPATKCIGSDRYAGHIYACERNARTIYFNHGTYTPDDPSNDIARGNAFTLRKNGMYRERGGNSAYLVLGIAEDYRDPSF